MTDLPDLARSRAILIGTTASADAEIPATPAAGGSLAGMRAVLTDAELCGWPDDNVTAIQDTSDITGLSLTLRRMARDAAEVLLVYFAGQGLVGSREEFCLSLAGTLLEDAEDTSLRYAQVRHEVLDSPARLKIVILDCPYSGHVITGLSGTRVADLTGIHGACVITASEHETGVPAAVGAGEAAAMTPFTAVLITTIRSGIPGGPAEITLDDIYSGLVGRLRANGLPDPTRRNIDLASQLPIVKNAAYNPGHDLLAKGSSPGVAQDQATAPRPGLLGRRQVIGVAAIALVAGATGSALAVTQSQDNTSPKLLGQGAGNTGQPDRTLIGPADQVFSVAFSPDDRFLAAGSRDANAWIWDITSPDNHGMPLPHDSAVQAVAFSHGGRLLATGSANGKVRLWETGTWRPIKFSGRDYIIKHEYAAWGVVFSLDDAILASGTSANAVTGPGRTVALCDVTGRRAPVFLPVVVEYWAAGLTCGYGIDMIGTHVCHAGLPAAGDRTVLARVAGPVIVGQGRGDTRAAARGRRAAPGESQAAHVLDRPCRARRAHQDHAESAARLADRDSRHAAALAPAPGGGEVAPAQAAGPSAGA